VNEREGRGKCVGTLAHTCPSFISFAVCIFIHSSRGACASGCVCAYVLVYVSLCACLFGYLCLCMPVSVSVCLCVQVDTLRTVTLPQLARYGITSDVELKVCVQGHRDCLSMLAPLYARWCVRHTQRERDTHTGTLHQPRSLPLCVPIRTGACLWACRAPAGALT
jgi:hypothetical protein